MSALPLPNGRAQFIDADGAPIVGGQVFTYVPGTTDPKSTWQDSGQTILNANPIPLDDLGSAAIWAVGAVRQIVYDSLGNLIWDIVTSNALGFVASIDLSNVPAVAFAGKDFSVEGRPGLASLSDRFGVVIDVKADYGAVGNNLTDDTAAITAAINAANSAADQSPFPIGIFFPGGVYKLTSALPDITNSVVLYSTSAREAVLAPNGNFDVITFRTSVLTRVANAGIRSLSIAANGMNGGFTIRVDNAQNFLMEDCLISSPWNGITIRQAGETAFSRTDIDKARGAIGFTATGTNAARNGSLDRCDVVVFDDCTFTSDYIPGVSTPTTDMCVIDGAIHTILPKSLRLLNCFSGFTAKNTLSGTQKQSPSFIYGKIETENTWLEGANFVQCNDVALDNIFLGGVVSQAGGVVGALAKSVRVLSGTCLSNYRDGWRIDAGAEDVSLFNIWAALNNAALAGFSGIQDLSGQIKVYASRLGGGFAGTAETQTYGLKGVTGTKALDVDANGNVTASYNGNIYLRDCLPALVTTPTTVTVGASPYVFQNTQLGPYEYMFSGGTVSLIEIDDGLSSYLACFTATSSSGPTLILQSGQRCRVTHTGAPIVRANAI